MSNSVVWEVGYFSPDIEVIDNGKPVRITQWVVLRYPEDLAIGRSILRDDEELDVRKLCEECIQRPAAGPPGTPSVVRCSDEEVAYEIAKIIPTARVQFGGTPGLYAFFDRLSEHLASVEEEMTGHAKKGDTILRAVPIDDAAIRKADLDPDHLTLNAETEEKLAGTVLGDYYGETWIHEPVPALDNMTPVDAVKTERGIQMVQELLIEMSERTEPLPGPLRVDVAKICEKLEIPVPEKER
jgi:hypothetical protein